MENSSKIARKIKSQITRFSDKLSGDFKKPLRKFLVEMLYGIQASKDVKLSNIARSLNEEILLIKTETRLSRVHDLLWGIPRTQCHFSRKGRVIL